MSTNDKPTAPIGGKKLVAKKLIRENADCGITEEDLEGLTTPQEFDEVIAQLQPKKAENSAPAEKPKMLNLNKSNAGKPPQELPPPEVNTSDSPRMNMAEKLNPLHYKNGQNNTYIKGSRIAMRYNEKTGDMEVF